MIVAVDVRLPALVLPILPPTMLHGLNNVLGICSAKKLATFKSDDKFSAIIPRFYACNAAMSGSCAVKLEQCRRRCRVGYAPSSDGRRCFCWPPQEKPVL